MKFKSFDPLPFAYHLVSVAGTRDLSLLHSIILVLQKIEERTRTTATPFLIATATAPFKANRQSSITQQPLSSIVSSIILSASLDSRQTIYQLLPGLNENLISDIAQALTERVCLVLEEIRASSSQTQMPDSLFGTSLDWKDKHTIPQQLFVALHKMILPDSETLLLTSTFLPLAPFLTRILLIVVPLSTDRSEVIHFWHDQHSQLLNIFLSLVLSLINTGTPSTLSTPPLSSLLSVLSIALVRLDTIPSSLDLHSRFCDIFRTMNNLSDPQMKQVVLALCSEGMEDRSDVTLNSFSLTFLNRWKGANAQSDVDHGFDDDVSDLNEPIDDDIMFESDSDVWSQHAGLSDDFCPFDDTVELQLIEQLNSPEIEEGSDLKWSANCG
ncbi:hypothetical protein BLNAU_24500 [Blattamonas nauphoetae]|uniref:Uncharacterized protein n=1 Tax=Blattamonas nauphoetae TaxID=2049346 RepID=A0ABQ9WQ37_9EUKA|nr:hypothetical protein BLNAU_24500 [Blattamonas nauphoetae]